MNSGHQPRFFHRAAMRRPGAGGWPSARRRHVNRRDLIGTVYWLADGPATIASCAAVPQAPTPKSGTATELIDE
jgi:hypothetical protein